MNITLIYVNHMQTQLRADIKCFHDANYNIEGPALPCQNIEGTCPLATVPTHM